MKSLRSKNRFPSDRQRKKQKGKRKGRNLHLFATARKSGLKNLRKTTVIFSLKEFVPIVEKNFIPTAQSKNSAVRNVRTRRSLNGLQKSGTRKRAITLVNRKNVSCAAKTSGRTAAGSFSAHRNAELKTATKNSLLIITSVKNRKIKIIYGGISK